MADEDDTSWTVAMSKKTKPWPKLKQIEDEKPQSQDEQTLPQDPTNRFAVLPFLSPFPFLELPREMRDLIYNCLAHEVYGVYCNQHDRPPWAWGYGTSTPASRNESKVLLAEYSRTCHQFQEELDEAYIAITPWERRVEFAIEGVPKNRPIDSSERGDRIARCMRRWDLSAKLDGVLLYGQPSDYSVKVVFDSKLPLGYSLEWKHLVTDDGMLAMLYGELVERVESTMAEAVRERHAMDEKIGFTRAGVERMVDAFYIQVNIPAFLQRA
ncbi:hypothetical protein LTR10_002955 [Elasticomyces elasticus]|nr:hypothetical protein LTR10_002955 [Elasticomyces elasticus]KAK4967708.1 hypothetical protein LTR42_010033 [Elasticomyces elasticus]